MTALTVIWLRWRIVPLGQSHINTFTAESAPSFSDTTTSHDNGPSRVLSSSPKTEHDGHTYQGVEAALFDFSNLRLGSCVNIRAGATHVTFLFYFNQLFRAGLQEHGRGHGGAFDASGASFQIKHV